MNTSAKGLAIIKLFEGFSETPYFDHKGYSIAYGHLIKPGENLKRVTREQGEQLLIQDVKTAENIVNGKVTRALSQNEFDALVSFVYNLGSFQNAPTLLNAVNSGDKELAASKFALYRLASGKVNAALVERRAKEAALFLSESVTATSAAGTGSAGVIIIIALVFLALK